MPAGTNLNFSIEHHQDHNQEFPGYDRSDSQIDNERYSSPVDFTLSVTVIISVTIPFKTHFLSQNYKMPVWQPPRLDQTLHTFSCFSQILT